MPRIRLNYSCEGLRWKAYPMQMEFKVIRLDGGSFVVKDELFDNIFASTRIDEALMFVRDKIAIDPLRAREHNETSDARDMQQYARGVK